MPAKARQACLSKEYIRARAGPPDCVRSQLGDRREKENPAGGSGVSLVFGVIVRTLRGDGGPGAVQGAFCDRSALLFALLARPIKKIALELLTIAEPEFGFRNRECSAVGEGFLLSTRPRGGENGEYLYR